MNILIADKFPAHWTEELAKHHTVTSNPALDENTLPQAVADTQILIVRSTKVPAAVIDAAPHLKLIIRAGAGYDTIDIQHAAQKGVAVCNCPGTNSIAVAELAMALLLALDRRIYDNVNDLRQGVWNKSKYSKAKGIFGRTLGIIGLGNIGKEVAKRAQAFGMKVEAWTSKSALQLPPDIRKAESLEQLFAQADVLSLHCPLTKDTQGLVNARRLSLMKPTAILVNTSRGPVVDEQALADALNAGRIYAAGLDVLSSEPPRADNPLLRARNCFITPHIAWASTEARQRLMRIAVDNLHAWLDGKPVNNVAR